MAIWYDRRTVDATIIQFFTESSAEHTWKEIGTNMIKPRQFPVQQVIKGIIIERAPTLLSSTTARDGALDDEIKRIIEDMIVEFLVTGQVPIRIPLSMALSSTQVTGALQYALATAADGSYAYMNLGKPGIVAGVEVEWTVPANTDFEFYIKSRTTPALGVVTVVLIS